MAPLFVSCSKLSQVYSPHSCRSSSLPGMQSRVVPFMCAPAHMGQSSRLRATASEPTTKQQASDPTGLSGSLQTYEEHQKDHRGVQASFSASTLAVHGGERAGRPRVSGTSGLWWSGNVVERASPSQRQSAGGHRTAGGGSW